MVIFLGIFAIVILFFIFPDFTLIALLVALGIYFWYIAIPLFIIWLIWKGLTKLFSGTAKNPYVVEMDIEDTQDIKEDIENYKGEDEENFKTWEEISMGHDSNNWVVNHSVLSTTIFLIILFGIITIADNFISK